MVVFGGSTQYPSLSPSELCTQTSICITIGDANIWGATPSLYLSELYSLTNISSTFWGGGVYGVYSTFISVSFSVMYTTNISISFGIGGGWGGSTLCLSQSPM